MNNPKHKGLGLGSLSRCTRARRKTSRREKKNVYGQTIQEVY